ncbi:hypothetical protein [Bradyrhizobium erythrophlei]|jgi:hypothetical protein|uniref:Glycosyl transferase family 2 n=1 Tax=Bradyrhizobium erythrophlei TaxID=1437360 RepID=A0A1M5UPY2_9BRAD|nr:hypothetical protein [Bradyrhizobium erythrophlei]SHH64980.1 hypothetical protein SAMN05444169_8567 [Bradyrhizobium erythrophlei]
MGLTLFTSLPPSTTRIVDGYDFGPAYQRACIASWIAAGFDVVSLNPENEIAELRKYDYPINYLISPNPRPKIFEFLKEASRSPSDLTGIINADCLLLNYPAFVQGILSGAREGLVMLERVNIDPNNLLPTGQTCLGFDAFFFNKSHASRLTIDPDLAVGQPWWDYWFPMEFVVSGIKLLRPQSPLVFHLDHEQGWSQARWLHYGRKFMTRFSVVDGTGTSSFSAGLHEFLGSGSAEKDDLGGFGDWCFNWLRDNAEYLKVSQDPTAAELFGRILAAITNFDGMHATTLALAQARRELALFRAQHELAISRAQPKQRNRPFLLRLLRVLLTSKLY